MKQQWLKTTLALSIAAISTHSLANGIAINEQSASAAGTAYAGRASSALDASTIYGNPAGLSKLKRREVSGGLAVIDAKVDIDHANGAAQGTNKGDSVPLSVVPFGYFSTPVDDRLTFGLGVYVPYGIINDYESSFQGRYLGSYSKVQVITVQPTVSYKITDRVSFGFGPTINRIDGQLKNNLNNAGAFGSGDATLNIKGHDSAFGFNAGIMVDLTDDTTWGLTYHSKVTYKLKGDTKVKGGNGPILGLANGKYDADLSITLPESVDTSITHRLNDQWTLHAGATWTRWSRLDTLEVKNSGIQNPQIAGQLGTVSEELDWHDTWAFSLGASYQLNPQWVLRTGFAVDAAPTSNDNRNVRIPVGNRKVFALGAGWSPNADLTIDVAYAYLWENDAKVDQPGREPVLPGLPSLQPGYQASYSNSAQGLMAQMTYRF